MSTNTTKFGYEVKLSVWTCCIKRIFDITISSFILLVIWPLFVFIAVFVKLSSTGPVFYRGTRSGLYGKPFRIFKFRTMVANAEVIGGPSTALNDPRLTSVGKILRKYKLDELPQLFNILKGEMSLVGPRPQVEQYTKLYTEEEKIILSVRPGITDYASIQFINLDSILGDNDVDEKYIREIEPKKNKLRIKYVKDISFQMDMKIMFLTFLQMFKIRSRWNTKN